VVLRGWPVAGEDAVEAFRHLVVELERYRALCILELPMTSSIVSNACLRRSSGIPAARRWLI